MKIGESANSKTLALEKTVQKDKENTEACLHVASAETTEQPEVNSRPSGQVDVASWGCLPVEIQEEILRSVRDNSRISQAVPQLVAFGQSSQNYYGVVQRLLAPENYPKGEAHISTRRQLHGERTEAARTESVALAAGKELVQILENYHATRVNTKWYQRAPVFPEKAIKALAGKTKNIQFFPSLLPKHLYHDTWRALNMLSPGTVVAFNTSAMASNQFSEQVAPFLSMAPEQTELQFTLDVSNSALSSKDQYSFKEFVQHQKLSTLKFRSMSFPEGINQFLFSTQTLNSIQHLDMSDNRWMSFSKDGWELTVRCIPKLHSLNLSGSGIGEWHIQEMFRPASLEGSPLVHLTLDDNLLSNDLDFDQLLRNLPHVVSISLKNNFLTEAKQIEMETLAASLPRKVHLVLGHQQR